MGKIIKGRGINSLDHQLKHHHLNQILSPEELCIEKEYVPINTRFGAGRSFSLEEVDKAKGTYTGKTSEGFKRSGTLADIGLVSYKHGLWNPANYLIPKDKC